MNTIASASAALVLALPIALRPAPTAPAVAPIGPAPVAVVQSSDPILPLPSANLEIPGGRSNLADLVAQVADLTGVSIRASGPALGRLSESPTGLVTDASIAPEAAWSFFECLIAQEGFALVELRASEPRLVAVVDLMNGRQNNGAMVHRVIEASELERYADHHALLIEVVLEMPHTDVRQLSNSMRSLITNQMTLNVIPAGNSDCMIVQGTAANVTEVARVLRTVDDLSAVRFAEIFSQGETEADGDSSDG